MAHSRSPGRGSLGLNGLGRNLGIRRQSSHTFPQDQSAEPANHTPPPAPLDASTGSGERPVGNMRLLGVRHVSMPIPTTVSLANNNNNSLLPRSFDPAVPSTGLGAAPGPSNPPVFQGPDLAPSPGETPETGPARHRFRSLTPRSIASLSNITKKLTSLSPDKGGHDSSFFASRRRSHGLDTGYPNGSPPGRGPVSNTPSPHFRVIHSSPEDASVPDDDPSRNYSASPLHHMNSLEFSVPSSTFGAGHASVPGLIPPAPVPKDFTRNDHSVEQVSRALVPNPSSTPSVPLSAGTPPLPAPLPPTMAQLPRELVYHVLRYVESAKDVISCSQMCTAWRMPALFTYRDLMNIYPYANMSLMRALRKRLRKHNAPVTMPLLDDIIYDLSQEYCRSNPEFRTLFGADNPVDSIYPMLWTFLFIDREFRNPAVKKKMSCQYFIKLVQGSYKHQVYSVTTLKTIYKDIKDHPILDRHIPIIPSAVPHHQRHPPPEPPQPEPAEDTETESHGTDEEVSDLDDLPSEIDSQGSPLGTSATTEDPELTSSETTPSLTTDEPPPSDLSPLPGSCTSVRPPIAPIFEFHHNQRSAPFAAVPALIDPDHLETSEPTIFQNINQLASLDLNLTLNTAFVEPARTANRPRRGSPRIPRRLRRLSNSLGLRGGQSTLGAIRQWWTQVKSPEDTPTASVAQPSH